MTKRQAIIGTVLGYSLVAFLGMFCFTSDSAFCGAPWNHTLQTLRLTVACTAWAIVVSSFGRYIANSIGKPRLAAVFIGGLAFVGFVSIPFWIYQGYGGRSFLFEGTWADVSCFFTE